MKDFYREQLAPIVRLADGRTRASTVSSAAAFGALFGLVVYGVYDFTNYWTLHQWPFVLTLADTAWGALASAAAAVAVRLVVQ